MTVRDVSREEADAIAAVSAAAFYDDPVMAWAFADPDARLRQLHIVFAGLVRDYVPNRGVVQTLEGACVSFWRRPDFKHGEPAPPGEQGAEVDDFAAFAPDVIERLVILDQAMNDAHPHDAHWYLNVLATAPERQGTGLGSQVMAPVLAICDAEGIPAYLESSNPRNMTLYRRNGFEQTGEIPLPEGPSLYPMWRAPRG